MANQAESTFNENISGNELHLDGRQLIDDGGGSGGGGDGVDAIHSVSVADEHGDELEKQHHQQQQHEGHHHISGKRAN